MEGVEGIRDCRNGSQQRRKRQEMVDGTEHKQKRRSDGRGKEK